MLSFISLPEANKVIQANNYGDVIKTFWSQGEVNSQEALEFVYNKCLEWGADCFITFTLTEFSEEYIATTVKGIKISGVAIKRED